MRCLAAAAAMCAHAAAAQTTTGVRSRLELVWGAGGREASCVAWGRPTRLCPKR